MGCNYSCSSSFHLWFIAVYDNNSRTVIYPAAKMMLALYFIIITMFICITIKSNSVEKETAFLWSKALFVPSCGKQERMINIWIQIPPMYSFMVINCSQGPFHEFFFKFNSNLVTISFWSHPSWREVTPIKFCTWYDSCTIVACAKLCSDIIPCNGVTPNKLSIEFYNWKLYAKWAPVKMKFAILIIHCGLVVFCCLINVLSRSTMLPVLLMTWLTQINTVSAITLNPRQNISDF